MLAARLAAGEASADGSGRKEVPFAAAVGQRDCSAQPRRSPRGCGLQVEQAAGLPRAQGRPHQSVEREQGQGPGKAGPPSTSAPAVRSDSAGGASTSGRCQTQHRPPSPGGGLHSARPPQGSRQRPQAGPECGSARGSQRSLQACLLLHRSRSLRPWKKPSMAFSTEATPENTERFRGCRSPHPAAADCFHSLLCDHCEIGSRTGIGIGRSETSVKTRSLFHACLACPGVLVRHSP